MRIEGDIYGIVSSLQERAEQYRRPARALPATSELQEMRIALARVRAELNNAQLALKKANSDNAKLAAALGDAQFKTMSLGKRVVSIGMVKDAFIVALAAENYAVDGGPYTDAHLVTPNRAARYAKPRQISMWLCRVITKQSTTIVGKAHGNRDHTTCLHAEQQVRDGKAFTSPMLRHAANRVLAQFGAESIK